MRRNKWETENVDEDALLRDLASDDEIPSYQQPKEEKKSKGKKPSEPKNPPKKPTEPRNSTNDNRTNSRKRSQDQSKPSIEDKISNCEQAIKSLKRHTEKGTCPESLQYRARARIRTDDAFKSDIKLLRKSAEQDFVRALTRFQYREIDRLKSKKRQSKRPKGQSRTVVKNITKTEPARSAPADINVTLDNVKAIAGNIQTNIESFKELMERLEQLQNKQSEKYTCLLSESHQHTRGADHNPPRTNMKSRKRKERRKIKHQKELAIQKEANKKHIKNLSNKELTDS